MYRFIANKNEDISIFDVLLEDFKVARSLVQSIIDIAKPAHVSFFSEGENSVHLWIITMKNRDEYSLSIELNSSCDA